MSHDDDSYMANVMRLRSALAELGAIVDVLDGDARRAMLTGAVDQ